MTDNATRLRALPGSFSSLDMEEVEASVPVQRPEEVDENSRIGNVSPSLSEGTTSLPDSTTKISMNQNGVTENERLRSEVADLQSQLLILRSHLQRERADRLHREEVQRKQLLQSQNKDKTRQGKGVVLEMPKSMSCLKSGTRDATQKDHQSLSTEDDQDTIEPSQDLEAHESAAGLKHRNHQPPSTPEPSSEMKKKKQTAKGQLSDDEDEEAGGLAPLLESCDKDGLLKMELEPMETGTTTPGADEQFWQSVSDRAGWLVGLLVLQSMSSFILARNEALLQQHLVIVRFLTMLVGAGGNAGNQASVRVIRGLAVGTIDDSNANFVLRREFLMGLTLSIILGTAGCIRAAVFLTPFKETVAITSSLFMIVVISIVLGAMMPLAMKRIGIDPAHSSTTIQVVMDILGVSITVWTSTLILGFHEVEDLDDNLR